MNNLPEKIICSAIWYKELNTPSFNPSNIDKGIVFSGLRHVYCLHQMVAMTGKRQCEVGEYQEGFLTSKNNFVGRKKAARIAIKQKQITHLKFSPSDLYSEDLF